MITVIVCAILGVFCAIAFDLYIPPYLSMYAAIVIIASLDAVMDAYKSLLADGFDAWEFLSSLFGNSILGALIVFFGKKIDLDLYIPVILVFTMRIFNNFAFARRYYLNKLKKKLKKC